MDISQSLDLIKFGLAALSFLGLYLYVRSFDWVYEWICRKSIERIEALQKARENALSAKREARRKRKAELAVRRNRRK